MNGKVAGFRARLNRLPFLEFKVARQGHIQLKDTRSLHVVTPEVAIGTGSRWGESRGVDPMVDGLMARIGIAPHQIRRLVSHVRQRAVRARVNREKGV